MDDKTRKVRDKLLILIAATNIMEARVAHGTPEAPALATKSVIRQRRRLAKDECLGTSSDDQVAKFYNRILREIPKLIDYRHLNYQQGSDAWEAYQADVLGIIKKTIQEYMSEEKS
jgi:hypothetical protein